MTKITTGLATAGLAALALGTLQPSAALASPTAPATSTAPSDGRADTNATQAPHVSEIVELDASRLSMNGVARGATSVLLTIPGGGGGAVQVVGGQFSLVVDREHLGKTATLVAFGPAGASEATTVPIELREDEGSKTAPEAPVVHAVTSYDDASFVIEGTVRYDPTVFDRTEVFAVVDGQPVRSALDENGGFALAIDAVHAGRTIDVHASRSELSSEVVSVVGTPTEGNTASDAWPLGIGAPAEGSVVDATPAFSGQGIPNSTIVVTGDGSSPAAATLCETRVAADGDWSCTSAALPVGDHDATVTETPMWASASTQTAAASFRVGDEQVTGPALPIISSVTETAAGFVVRGIAHRAFTAEAAVDGHTESVRTRDGGRFTATLPLSARGEVASITGVSMTGQQGRSVDVTVEEIAAPPASPLTAPLVHAVTQVGDRLFIEGTTAHDPVEFDTPTVLARVDGRIVGIAAFTYNGAFTFTVPAEHLGSRIEVMTARGATFSQPTVVTELKEANDAPVAYPLEVASPADGSTVTTPTPTFTGDAIPGSTITVTTTSTSTTDTATCDADVLADGTWTCDTTTPLSDGTHTTTITETPWWASAGTPTTTTTYTVTTTDDDTRPSVDVTSHTTGDTFIPTRTTTFHGTGTPGATITLTPQGNLLPVTATVQDDTDGDGRGTWSTTKFLGTGTYHLTATQTLDDEPVGDPVTDLTIHPATTAPLTLASHTDGDTFTPNTTATFTGTASPHAHIVIRPHGGLPPVTTDADDDGNWSTTRFLGGGTYHLTITQHLDGEPWGTPTRLTITPTTPLP